MVDNDNKADFRRCMEDQEQSSKTQQEALENIQHMLIQLMTDRNYEENFDNKEWEEENRTPENKNAKESSSSSIDAEVTKRIQTQIASLAQRDELKKVGMTRP